MQFCKVNTWSCDKSNICFGKDLNVLKDLQCLEYTDLEHIHVFYNSQKKCIQINFNLNFNRFFC